MRAVAVLGASRDRRKYGNKSVRAHARAGWQVFPVNPQADEIEGFRAYRSLRDLPIRPIDRVSVYVPPEIGLTLLDDIAACQPSEVWLNPGSESDELIAAAESLGLPVLCACVCALQDHALSWAGRGGSAFSSAGGFSGVAVAAVFADGFGMRGGPSVGTQCGVVR